MYMFNQEPGLNYMAPYAWLVKDGILVKDPELYQRAVDTAKQLGEEMAADGDDYVPWLVEVHLPPFIEMHRKAGLHLDLMDSDG